MNQFLGFITAFFVVGWAVRWYFRQGQASPQIEWQPPREDTVLPAVTKWETLTGVIVEASLDKPPVIESTPATFEYEPADDVERRLAELVTEEEEPEPPQIQAPESADRRESLAEKAAIADDTAVGRRETEAASVPSDEPIVGFCARCRDKRQVLNPVRTQTKKGKAAIRGSCEVCGAGMFVFISEER